MKNSIHEVGESSGTATKVKVDEDIQVIVILDGSILYHCLKYGLPIDDIKPLFEGFEVEFYVTECTIFELDTISQRYPGCDITPSLQFAKTLPLWKCNHAFQNLTAESCIKTLVGINNYHQYYVATTASSFLLHLRSNNRNLLITASETEFYFSLPPENEPAAAILSEDEEMFVDEDERNYHFYRLHTRCELSGFAELEVDGDGNCQFRALSDQLYHTEERHIEVRERIVDQLYSYPELYNLPILAENRRAYLESLLINGTRGDGITLQAAADYYNVRIFVAQSEPVLSFSEVCPNVPLDSLRFDRVIHLSYLQDEHYNSLYPAPREIRRLWGNSPNSHYWL